MRIDYSDDSFLAPREYFYEKRDLTLLTVNEKTRDEAIKIKGKIDGNGFIYVDDDGKIYIENICNKDYCANGPEKNIIITPNPSGEVPKLDKADPMIKLNGNAIMYIEINGEYKEEGAVAKTKLGEKLEYTTEIRRNNEVVESIETNKEATYKITYTTENNGKTVSITRTVEVLDMTPVITMTEPSSNYVKPKEVLMNVSAIRPNKIEEFSYQINDGEKVKVIGTSKVITLNTTGVYTIKVTVTDNNGHRNEISKTYKIDSEPPVLAFENVELKIDEVAGYNLMTGVTASDDSELEPTVSYSGGLSAVIGTQTVTYTAEDEAGNIGTKVRTFTIIQTDLPIVSFSPIETTGWVKSVNITISATVKVGETLTDFSYSINNETAQNGDRSENSGTASIILNRTGTYTIEASATGGWGNSKTENSGTYHIDATEPEVGTIGGNTGTYSTSKTLTATLEDSNSGVSAYAVTTSSEEPNTWTDITSTASYNLSYPVTSNNTYYIWAKDTAGNISSYKSVEVTTIDTTTPSLTVSNYSGKVGDNVLLSSRYTATFGGMSGSVTCKYGSTTITNVNYFSIAGTYSVSCTAYGSNGKNSGAKTMTITLVTPGKTGTELATSQGLSNVAGGYRFQGPDPNNYVSFNGELYRIIGIFNGQMKLIKNDFYSTSMAWDTNGKNDWSKASLMTELNTTYWNSINSTYQNMVDQSHSWNLGGWMNNETARKVIYESENSTTVYSGNPTEWIGKIGLMYPSDYAYSTSGGTLCDETEPYTWLDFRKQYVCATESWLYNATYTQWTITARSGDANDVRVIYSRGSISSQFSSATGLATRPSFYLKPSIKITSGDGASSTPFTLG